MKRSIGVLGCASVIGFGGAGCGGEPCDPSSPDTICTIAGAPEDHTGGFAGDGGPATNAKLYAPIDVAMSPAGELWILDFNNYVIRAIDKRGTIRTVVGSGELGDSPEAGVASVPALEAQLNHTSDMLFHGDYLYIAAWHNSRVKRIRLSDMMLENVAGRGRRIHYDGDGGPAIDASLDLPSSLAIAPTGDLVVMDQGNQVIRAIDGSGTIRTIAGKCVADYEPCGADEPAACPDSHKLACGTDALRCDRLCMPAFAGDGGHALDARIGQPFGAQAMPAGHMAYDSAGNLIFADSDNHRIRKIDPAGIISTIAGTGERGYSGDDGLAIAAMLHFPVDIEIAADDSIYFTDVYNNCVRKIDPAGVITRVAGRCETRMRPMSETPSIDGGSPLDATLDRPFGIELVGDVLYVTETFEHRIRAANLRR